MLQVNRTGVLAALLVVSLGFVPPVNGIVLRGAQAVADRLDSRPEQSALFIGNSRTFYHGMPEMVRSIADSDGFPQKFRIEMDAQPGVSLADHRNNPQTQARIARDWDHVVLQVLSSEQYSADHAGSVWEAASDLIAEIEADKARPAMFVTWRYTDQCSENEGLPPSAIGLPASGYANMHLNIQRQHELLKERTGVDLVNVGAVWEHLQDGSIPFSLYDDCNHPSIYGSYLSALMFYSYFSGRDVAGVTYRPREVSPEHAAVLREAVSDYLGRGEPG